MRNFLQIYVTKLISKKRNHYMWKPHCLGNSDVNFMGRGTQILGTRWLLTKFCLVEL